MTNPPLTRSDSAACFVIENPLFDSECGDCRFSYRLDGKTFVETLHFPPGYSAKDSQSPQFLNLLNMSACVLGVSYFKLLAPTCIELPDFGLSKVERKFVLDLYENGLGEFYARNDLHRFGKISLPPSLPASPPELLPSTAPRKTHSPNQRALLLIGGGKDSLVSVQLAQRANVDFTPFAVNPKGPILSSIARLGQVPLQKSLYVMRELDPQMIHMSGADGYFNGHVPSTAINSMIAALAALLFGYDTVILSNERSASQGNILHDGRQVNHQYSKSFVFETGMRQMLDQTARNRLQYFSLLRPYSELRIAEMFAQNTRFDLAFSSCNKNFTLQKHTGTRWCGACPKCHFVFLIFAPFMSPQRLTAIFGHNILSNTAHLKSFRRLAGLEGQKPWECVGEILEAASCLHKLSLDNTWKEFGVVSALGSEVRAFYGAAELDSAWNELMQDSTTHHIPPIFSPRATK